MDTLVVGLSIASVFFMFQALRFRMPLVTAALFGMIYAGLLPLLDFGISHLFKRLRQRLNQRNCRCHCPSCPIAV